MNWTKKKTKSSTNKASLTKNSSDRMKYDMNQALMMRGETSSSSPFTTKTKSLVHSNSNSNGTISSTAASTAASASSSQLYNETKSRIHSSLQGLDNAENLSSKHKYEEAQRIYMKHIGELINILNEMKINTSLASKIGISRDVLRERTQVALTEAELNKQKIMNSSSARIGSNGKRQDQGLKYRIDLLPSSSLLNMNTKISTSARTEEQFIKPTKNLVSSRLSHQKSQSSKEITSQTKKKQVHHDDMIIPSSSKSATTDSTKTQSKPKRISNLNYNINDPFITTIKNDMYIDSKTLSTSWNDIAGLVTAKRSLQEAAILPLLRPDLYTGLRSPPRGILLYGPPGTGKTLLVKATAYESQCILFSCSASSMTSKWVGEGEKLVRTLFRMAFDVAPSIIFLDEIDSLLGRRKSGSGGEGDSGSESESSRRFKTEFMIQMDGIAAGKGCDDTDCDDTDVRRKVLLIGATNCPWDIDDAIMRRFQRRIYVPLPDQKSRLHLWNELISKSNSDGCTGGGGGIDINQSKVLELVRLTEGFSCSDITSVANEASFYPLRDLGDIEAIKGVKSVDVRPILFKDFKSAIINSKKSVSKTLLDKYRQWEEAQSVR